MHPFEPLPLDQAGFRAAALVLQGPFEMGVEGQHRRLMRAERQSKIVRHPKDPRSLVPDLLATLAQSDIEPEEYFLCGILRFRRGEPQRQKIAVNVFAPVEESPGNLIVKRSYFGRRHGNVKSPALLIIVCVSR